MNGYSLGVVMGNLTRDPETRHTRENKPVTRLSVAVNRFTADGEDTSYFTVVTFGTLAERCAEYLKKGRPILAQGELREDRWQADGGQTRSDKVLYAAIVKFLGKPNGTPGATAHTETPPS